jgi:hypothetical protein
VTDPRVTPFSGRAAHVSLRGRVAAEAFVDGEALRVTAALADLTAAPGGARERQLLAGDAFLVIDRRDGWAFGQSDRGGTCGWVRADDIGAGPAPTHWVSALATHLYPEPRVQARAGDTLSLGAKVHVSGIAGAWAETQGGFVPSAHLRPIGERADDPVDVARMFLGTPYLWGGNSRLGLDCSGLVQAAWLACGRDCPGDSDQQAALGVPVDDARRGDLIFWKGHVAIVTGEDRILHANGHTMNVAYEGLATAIARIALPHQVRRTP